MGIFSVKQAVLKRVLPLTINMLKNRCITLKERKGKKQKKKLFRKMSQRTKTQGKESQ